MAYKPSDRHRERDRRKPGRTLYLKLQVNQVPYGTRRSELLDTLIGGIAEGDYELPDGWDVELLWRNKADAPWRSDDYEAAMVESAANGRGFDVAVARYLESQRYRRA